jgi:hypothetical protein
MQRRQFIKSVGFAIGLGAVGVPLRVPEPGGPKPGFAFFVAGARFHAPPEDTRRGSLVVLEKSLWRGQRAIRITTKSGQPIGFVPQSLVSLVDQADHGEWRVASFNPDAVPWKRCRVAWFDQPTSV